MAEPGDLVAGVVENAAIEGHRVGEIKRNAAYLDGRGNPEIDSPRAPAPLAGDLDVISHADREVPPIGGHARRRGDRDPPISRILFVAAARCGPDLYRALR